MYSNAYNIIVIIRGYDYLNGACKYKQYVELK